MISIDEKTLEFLKANPDEYYLDEKLTKYQFIDNSLVVTKTYFNSKDALISWQNKMINDPRYKDIEHSWSVLTADYNEQFPDLVNREIGHHKDTPLSAFRNYIDDGFYPPPEVLFALNDCFNVYMGLRGRLELEDIFYGERKRGVGNYSARKSRIEAYEYMFLQERFNELEQFIKLEKKKKSKSELAEEVIECHKLDDDIDSFLRGYNRFLKRGQKM